MFLDVLRRRNPAFIEAAMRLHQEGQMPANSYVLDLDTVEANARVLKTEADRLGLKIFAMTKQFGRASSACQAIMRGGITHAVAVDMACARATHRAGMKLGHLGHLQQVAKSEAAAAARTLQPDYWTVFNDDEGARSRSRRQGRRPDAESAGAHPGRRRHLLSRPRRRL